MKQSGANYAALRKEWLEGWYELMDDIWKEQLIALRIHNTGDLYRSVAESNFIANDGVYHISHSFLTYGIYVERGTGREIPKGNPADLGFNPVRIAQKWLGPKRYASYMNLKEFMERSYAGEFVGMMSDTLSD